MVLKLAQLTWCSLILHVLIANRVAASDETILPAEHTAGAEKTAGPLLTRWAREVTPERVHPEYPRPQMVRQRWVNLNGLWDYAVTSREAGRPGSWNGKILVPFPIESSLSGVMKALKPQQRLWYRRSFSVPGDWSGNRVLLRFGAVDWQSTVYLNGRELGSHRGGYDPFVFDITRAIRPGEAQELVVSVWDPTDTSWQLHGKQSMSPAGCNYTASSGIWQTVWLEPVPMTSSIETLRAMPDCDSGVLRLTITGRVGNKPLKLQVKVHDGCKTVSSASGLAGFELWPSLRDNKVTFYKNTGSWFSTNLILPMKQARLWSPGDPFLYDLTVTLGEGDVILDKVKSYFGMRSIAKKADPQRLHEVLAQRQAHPDGRRPGPGILARWRLHRGDRRGPQV